ncbi:TPA: hypothetical protein R7D43_004813 [Klebsiella pneumoniae]|uniref:hypothetical protein n=1 Tax=Klebsiella pneumoniae complex TaxID=3390273 RepID=UPI001B8B9396|nr:MULTISPECIES: hypothetical protein [Klebsiella]MBS2935837.1 hypothetical protein [Klebsiella pneumoniae]HDF5704845.1 hypothetical protein [Klebsiella variicola]HDG7947346.1 hypothetical protein [Klebsiella variicola]HEE4120337.1 hypothetical protein [Klebsiella pneumoniae]
MSKSAGERKVELVFDEQEMEMLARNCAARRQDSNPLRGKDLKNSEQGSKTIIRKHAICYQQITGL